MNAYLESLQENRETIHQILEAQRDVTSAHAGVTKVTIDVTEKMLGYGYLGSLKDTIKILDLLIE